jgi:hypothetical protein
VEEEIMIRAGSIMQKVGAISCALLLPYAVSFGQTPVPQQVPIAQGTQPQAGPLLTGEQLDNLVAPIALYPDPLLGQVLAASTYPLEIAEAQQWLQRNGNLQGTQLMDAARQQNWDPSVQALVAFPDVLKLLGNDLRWTTDLGNAYLAQQNDVMAAVQVMRSRAQSNGRLQTTAQQVVTTENQDGQSAIQIQPADPQVIYVPVYQPQYVYGPPLGGYYPDLWYPPGYGYGIGFGFLPGIYCSSFFPGWFGWGGWGWGLGWFGGGFGRGVFVNAGFFNRFGFHGGFGGGFGRGFGGRAAWAHAPEHRMGVPYSNRSVAGRFNSNRVEGNRAGAGFNGGRSFAEQNRGGAGTNRGFAEQNRGAAGANRGFAEQNRGTAGAGGNGGWRTFNGNGNNRAATPGAGSQSFRSQAPSQGFRSAAPSQGFRSAPSYSRSATPSGQNNFAARPNSAPRQSFSAPSRSFSAPSGGGSRSFSGGGGGGHSSGGGGGGGHHR